MVNDRDAEERTGRASLAKIAHRNSQQDPDTVPEDTLDVRVSHSMNLINRKYIFVMYLP